MSLLIVCKAQGRSINNREVMTASIESIILSQRDKQFNNTDVIKQISGAAQHNLTFISMPAQYSKLTVSNNQKVSEISISVDDRGFGLSLSRTCREQLKRMSCLRSASAPMPDAVWG